MIRHTRQPVRLILCICLFGMILLSIVLSVFPLSRIVVARCPENFAWQARNALDAGKASEAIAIAQRRVQAEDYDFGARRLLAQALLSGGISNKAVDVMAGSLDRAQTISWRNVHSRGFDVAADYRLFEQALRQNYQLAYAEEMRRAGDDAELLTTSLLSFQAADDTTAPVISLPPPGLSLIDIKTAKISSGSTKTKSGALNFFRKSSVDINLPETTSSGDILWFQVRGGNPMGFGALLKISINGDELIRLYADDESPRWVAVPVPGASYDSNLLLTAQFLNDEFDPITKADRNVDLLQVGVEHTP